MQEILVNAVNVIVGLLIGAVSGYAYAYFSGLSAMRHGMQLMLRSCLNDMYVKFQTSPPTDAQKREYEELYQAYEKLGKNGVMDAKHEAVLKMPETVRK